MNKVRLYLGYAGHCYAKENYAIQGGRKQDIPFYALFGLIHHPLKGWILYDTGYTRRFYEATQHFPYSLYAHMTKVVVTEADEVKTQLRQFGMATTDIQHIILTHFHADHIGGLKDFPHATIYCSRLAYQQVLNISSFWGVTKGLLKSLLPDDLHSRIKLVEDCGRPVQDDIFGVTYDLFHDSCVRICALPGHAAGQIGVQLTTEQQKFFLISDACWLRKSYEDMTLPDPIVRLFFDSWKDFKTSLAKVHQFHLAHPMTLIIPTHCHDTNRLLVSKARQIQRL